MNFQFKSDNTFEERRREYERVIKEHPNRIAIICEKAPKSKIKDIDKTKYLVDENLSFPQFSATIRKKLELDDKEGLFFLVNGKSTLSGNISMAEIYKKYKNKDGFLYIAYAAEEIWG